MRKITEIIKNLKKGGMGSGRRKGLVSQALSEAHRLSTIGNGASIHKRANLRQRLIGLCALKNKEGIEGRIEQAIKESKMIKSFDDKVCEILSGKRDG